MKKIMMIMGLLVNFVVFPGEKPSEAIYLMDYFQGIIKTYHGEKILDENDFSMHPDAINHPLRELKEVDCQKINSLSYRDFYTLMKEIKYVDSRVLTFHFMTGLCDEGQCGNPYCKYQKENRWKIDQAIDLVKQCRPSAPYEFIIGQYMFDNLVDQKAIKRLSEDEYEALTKSINYRIFKNNFEQGCYQTPCICPTEAQREHELIRLKELCARLEEIRNSATEKPSGSTLPPSLSELRRMN